MRLEMAGGMNETCLYHRGLDGRMTNEAGCHNDDL